MNMFMGFVAGGVLGWRRIAVLAACVLLFGSATMPQQAHATFSVSTTDNSFTLTIDGTVTTCTNSRDFLVHTSLNLKDLMVVEGDELTCTYTHIDDDAATADVDESADATTIFLVGDEFNDVVVALRTSAFSDGSVIANDADATAPTNSQHDLDMYVVSRALSNTIGFGMSGSGYLVFAENIKGTTTLYNNDGIPTSGTTNVGGVGTDTAFPAQHIKEDITADTTFTIKVTKDTETNEHADEHSVKFGVYNASNTSVTNNDGNARAIQLYVKEASGVPSLSAVEDQILQPNAYQTLLPLPAASGGEGTITYAVTGLPTALSFSPTTREIKGTPAAEGTSTVTYTATDEYGADTATEKFDIIVRAFTLTVADAGYATASRDKTLTVSASHGTPLTNTVWGLVRRSHRLCRGE